MMTPNAALQIHWRFHFQSFWPKLPGFDDVVAEAWQKPVPGADRIIGFHYKLKNTAYALCRWSAWNIANIREQIMLPKEIILRLDMAMDIRNLSSQERWLRADLKKKLLGLHSLQRTIARKKSRISMINEGDANPIFFHRQAARRRKNNLIFKLKRGDMVGSDQVGMDDVAFEHFNHVLGTPAEHLSSINLGALRLPPPPARLQELEANLMEEQIWEAIRGLSHDMASGPDGFTSQFYQRCWPIIKGDILAVSDATATDCFHGSRLRTELLSPALVERGPTPGFWGRSELGDATHVCKIVSVSPVRKSIIFVWRLFKNYTLAIIEVSIF